MQSALQVQIKCIRDPGISISYESVASTGLSKNPPGTELDISENRKIPNRLAGVEVVKVSMHIHTLTQL